MKSGSLSLYPELSLFNHLLNQACFNADMVYVDPRANPTLGAEFISGQITDKALALLDILNQVSGSEGRNVKQMDVLEDGQLSNLTLGVHSIQADYNAKPWEANQLVYFQSTPQRLKLIQQQLQDNLTKIESDITSNIGTLFDLIGKNATNGGLDIEGQLNSAETILNAANGGQILDAGKNLEDKILALLTSDSGLDTIVDAFIAKFKLDISRLDSEIFDLLDDKDDVFSSGANGQDSTDSSAAKYLVGFGADKPAIIASSLDEVFDLSFKAGYEGDHGAGSWNSDVEKEIVFNFTGSGFQKGTLKIDPRLIDAIIQDKNIGDTELGKITQQAQFYQNYTFEGFLSFAGDYYGTGSDTDATMKKLTLEHLKFITPQYFDDNRTLQDIVSGKASNSDSSNINEVFQSAGDQIKEAASGAVQLLNSGYKSLSKNNFEDFVRDNPILMVQYLEEKKNDPNFDPTLTAGINNQIKQLVEFNTRKVQSQINYYTEANKRLKREDPTNTESIQHNEELLNVLQGNGGILAELKAYQSGPSVNRIINLYNNDSYPELKLGTLEANSSNNSPLINDDVLSAIIKTGLSIQSVHAALYVTEMQEAAKKNAQFSMRELPKASPNGEIAEDKAVAPPIMSPTALSAAIAAIGNEILYKANGLLADPNVPDSNWVNTNAKILKDIDDQIAAGELAPGTTTGQAFLDNLKSVFKNVIKQFVTSDVKSFKDSVDQAKTAIRSETVLEGSDPNTTLDSNNIKNNLDNIEEALTGDVFADSNFINKAGLGNVKQYLGDSLNQLTGDHARYNRDINTQDTIINSIQTRLDSKIAKKQTLESELDPIDQTTIDDANDILQTLSLPPGQRDQLIDDLASEDPDLISSAVNNIIGILDDDINQLLNDKEREINKKNRLEDSKNSNQRLLNQISRLLNDPGEINDLFTRLTNDVNSVIDPNNPPADIKSALLGNYKIKLEAYSNKLTDHFKDDSDGNGTTDIEQKFQDALVDTSLDLNHDGINDFQNIQNTINKISELGDSISNIFGGKDAKTDANGKILRIDQQSIKRLVLMMFLLSILEYSDWEYRQSEADVSRYAVE